MARRMPMETFKSSVGIGILGSDSLLDRNPEFLVYRETPVISRRSTGETADDIVSWIERVARFGASITFPFHPWHGGC